TGQWNPLGTFFMTPGGEHRVVVDDRAVWDDGLTADAVQYRVSPTALREASWPLSVAQTGLYRVYARWPARPDNAIDAVYTVHHAGGASAVTVNQRADGSQWNLLGTYSPSLGAAHKVVLTSATNGAAVADAILVVAETDPESASFAWSPTLPSVGLVAGRGPAAGRFHGRGPAPTIC
ncbi:MAG: hypothetical protein V3T29_04020, partial [Alphaproteobacteria bacterium]